MVIHQRVKPVPLPAVPNVPDERPLMEQVAVLLKEIIPQPLFQTRAPGGVAAFRTHYVPSRDGQRFLVNMATDAVTSPITVVLNWNEELKQRVPTR